MMLLAFTFVLLLGLSLAMLLWALRPTKEQKKELERLRKLTLKAKTTDEEEKIDASLLKEPYTNSFSGIEAILERIGLRQRLRRLIEQAASTSSPSKVVAQSLAYAAAAALAAGFFGLPWMFSPLPGLIAAIIPTALLRFKRARRLKAFNDVLPDSIDLMARALRAGRSVASAIEVIAEQGQEPVASEFSQVFKQQNFGLPFRDSLVAMAERVDSKDLQFLITAMLVQKETGGNLTEILDRTAHVIRERIRIHGEVRVKTAQGRLTGWILSALPILMGVLINFVNPGFEKPLFTDPIGRIMLYCGAGMLVVGGLIIRKIVDIEI
jgi:tight adherence protein B